MKSDHIKYVIVDTNFIALCKKNLFPLFLKVSVFIPWTGNEKAVCVYFLNSFS